MSEFNRYQLHAEVLCKVTLETIHRQDLLARAVLEGVFGNWSHKSDRHSTVRITTEGNAEVEVLTPHDNQHRGRCELRESKKVKICFGFSRLTCIEIPNQRCE